MFCLEDLLALFLEHGVADNTHLFLEIRRAKLKDVEAHGKVDRAIDLGLDAGLLVPPEADKLHRQVIGETFDGGFLLEDCISVQSARIFGHLILHALLIVLSLESHRKDGMKREEKIEKKRRKRDHQTASMPSTRKLISLVMWQGSFANVSIDSSSGCASDSRHFVLFCGCEWSLSAQTNKGKENKAKDRLDGEFSFKELVDGIALTREKRGDGFEGLEEGGKTFLCVLLHGMTFRSLLGKLRKQLLENLLDINVSATVSSLNDASKAHINQRSWEREEGERRHNKQRQK